MTVTLSHRWRKMQGMRVFTLLAVWCGYGRAGVTILNFAVEIEADILARWT